MEQKQSCFVIAPIGLDGSETRKRSDQILKHVITPAAELCGYEPVRADKISEPGLITSQVIQRILEDPLVIADLTESNPNVFYELALRHVVRKPLIQIIKKGEQVPFDVANMRTIPVDHHDLDSVAEARSEITKQIKAIEGKGPEQIETPVSISIELQNLRQSEDPEQRSLAEILALIVEMRAEIGSIDKRMSVPGGILPAPYLREVLMESWDARISLGDFQLGAAAEIVQRIIESESVPKNSEEFRQLLELMGILEGRMMFSGGERERRPYSRRGFMPRPPKS